MKFQTYFVFVLLVFIAVATFTSVRAEDKDPVPMEKRWVLYTWIDNEVWKYSLVKDSTKHPDADDVKYSSTDSLERIKTRISLLKKDSEVKLNPLPILNLELLKPDDNTIQEFTRVSDQAHLTFVVK